MPPKGRKASSPAGVTEIQYRRAMAAIQKIKDQAPRASNTTINVNSSSVIDAAALQFDMARRYNLSSLPPSAPTQQPFTRPHEHKEVQEENINERDSNNTSSNGWQSSFGTLAQRRSLAVLSSFEPQHGNQISNKLAKKAVSQMEWSSIEFYIADRSDLTCPICMDAFKQGNEVLLSCSHVFHRRCLQSFEKFMKNGNLTCPICRTSNYQKKLTNIGTDSYKKSCVEKIQRLWRGCMARKKYHVSLRTFYRSGNGAESRRKKFFESELHSIAKKLSRNCTDRSDQVDSMLSSMDRTVMENQQLNALFDNMMSSRLQRATAASRQPDSLDDMANQLQFDRTQQQQLQHHHLQNIGNSYQNYDTQLSEQEWRDVLSSSLTRGSCDCAICMLPINMVAVATEINCRFSSSSSSSTSVPNNGPSNNISCNCSNTNKRIVVLSCSHLFHEFCIHNFEKFLGLAIPTCPVCRSSYEKLNLIQN
eukprot:gene23140-31457_t